MKLTKILAVALAVLVVGAGAAAAIPGQAADQAHSDDSSTAADGERPDGAGPPADVAGNETNESAGANASERRGPPEDMPGPVPDHVSQIHETINDWLDSGKEGSLGDMISDIVGGGDEADESTQDENSKSGDEASTDDSTETSTDESTSTEDGSGNSTATETSG